MSIVPLPLPPHAEARALLHHLLEHGDLVGRDGAGRTVIKLAIDDWMLDRLAGFDADAAEIGDQGDDEPDVDDDVNGSPLCPSCAGPGGQRLRGVPAMTRKRPGRWERAALRAGVSLDDVRDMAGEGKLGRFRYLVELRKRIAVAARSPDDGTAVENTWSTIDQFRPWREVYVAEKRRKK